jgi:hypothetical protein
MSAASTGDALICAVIDGANRAALAQKHCGTARAIGITLSHCY